MMNSTRTTCGPTGPAWKTALCLGAVAIVVVCCDDQVAGTSVGTGNPTEIQVSFRNDSDAAVALTGSIRVYASTQIPVGGFLPAPLLTIPVDGGNHAGLKADAFKSLADSNWPKGSIENGIYKFNLVVTGQTSGTVLHGFSLNKIKGEFQLRPQDSALVVHENVATIKGGLAPLITLSGNVDTTTFNAKWYYHLFIYGTGFTAKIEHGEFAIENIPTGQYISHLLLVPSKDAGQSGVDSSDIFSLGTPIGIGVDTIRVGTKHDRVPLPDSLRTK